MLMVRHFASMKNWLAMLEILLRMPVLGMRIPRGCQTGRIMLEES
jgi:hypothetical protein